MFWQGINGYCADTEVQDLGAISNPTTTDELYIVDDPSGTPASKKINIGALLGVGTDLDTNGALSTDSVSANELNATGVEAELEAVMDLQDMQGAVTDAQVPDNITVDLSTLATTLTITDNESTNENNAVLFTSGGDLDGGDLGIESDGTCYYNPSSGTLATTEFSGGGSGLTSIDAATGDNASSFFDAGTIEHERGGLEADVNAYSGLVGINATATSEVDTETELETHLGGLDVVTVTADDITSANLATLINGETGTGDPVFSTSPTFVTGITVPNNSISNEELSEGDNFDWTGTHTFGIDDTGVDVKFYGASSGSYMLWDESEDELTIEKGDINIKDDTAHLRFWDTDDNVTYEWHLDTGSTYANYGLWRGSSGAVSPNTPLMYFDNSNDVTFSGIGTFDKLILTNTANTFDDIVSDNDNFTIQITEDGRPDAGQGTEISFAGAYENRADMTLYADGEDDGDWLNYMFFRVAVHDNPSPIWDSGANIQISAPLDIMTCNASGGTPDQTDFIRLQTASNIPELTTVGACDLKITASGGDIDFDNENLTTTGNVNIDSDSNGLILGDDQDATLSWNNTLSDAELDDDLRLTQDGVSLELNDPTDTSSYKIHYDASATYPFGLWYSDDGTAYGGWPLMDSDDTNIFFRKGSVTVSKDLNATGLYSKGFAIEDLAAADDNYEVWIPTVAVTITKIGVHCRGTCTTTAHISLEDRAGNAMTHITPIASTSTNNTIFVDVTAANSLVAGEGLRFDVDNTPSPETDEYMINWEYTVDAQ